MVGIDAVVDTDGVVLVTDTSVDTDATVVVSDVLACNSY